MDHHCDRTVRALRGPSVDHPAPYGIPGLIRSATERTPDAVACTGAGETWTYRRLEEVSDRLAAELLRRGPSEDRPVGVLADRGPYMVAALLGVLKAGLPYLPLATDESAERLALILDTARPDLVVGTTAALAGWRGPEGVALLDVEPLAAGPDPAHLPQPLRPVAPDQPVNIIFTSGSTGTPKGVVVPSGGVTNRLLWGQRHYGLTAGDSVLQKTPYTFDVSGWEIYWPLIVGARLVLLAPGEHADPAAILKAVTEHRVTVCHFVPSMLDEFLRWPDAADCTSLRHVFCSGEALPAALARTCVKTLPARLHNLYGPTEASIEVTYWDSPEDPSLIDDVPIGRAVDNCELLVLDGQGRPVAEGEAGELCIGGVPLALGYLGRPDLTERVFVPAPEGSGLDRVYRTGDLVRVVDGQIRYHGRIDEQVKIRGVRVEPGEVESVLREHPGVDECAVVAAGEGAPRLVAFVRPHGADPGGASGGADWQEECRAHVAARLPSAYVPSHFVALETMPLTRSGKQDRVLLRQRAAALLAPLADAPAAAVAGGDPLARLWAQALGLDSVDEDADFLALGGHSLAAVRLRGELLRSYGLRVTLAELLRERITLAGLRRRAAAAAGPAATGPAGGVLPRRPDPARAPVSGGQRRLWLMEQLYPRLSAYNVVAAVRIAGGLDTGRLHEALTVVVQRHESLRTALLSDASGPYQAVAERVEPPLETRVVDGSLTEERCRALAARAAAEPLPVDRAPLLRVLYAQGGDGDGCLVAVLHHAVADQRSVDVFLAELAAAYSGFPPAQEAPHFGDLLVDRAGREDPAQRQADLAYWVDRLRDAPRTHGLPFQARRPAVTTFGGGAVDAVVGGAQARLLDEVARGTGVTPVAVVLAAFATVLTSWSGQGEVVVGVPWSSRDGGPSEDVIGFLIDTLPVRVDVGSAESFSALVRQVSDTMVDAHGHAGADFEEIVRALGLPRNLSRNPLHQIWFNDLTHAAAAPSFDGVPAVPVDPDTTGSLFDLGLYLHRDGESGYRLRLVHALDVFDAETARHLLGQVVRLLREAPADPGRAPAGWRLGGDRPALGPVPRPALTGVAEAFDRAAAQHADRVAISHPGGRMTYAELHGRVTARAQALRAAGWAGRAVLLPGDRSPATVVELLAAWHCACSVALVDAALPARRLRAALAGSGAEAVLAGGGADWPVPVLTGPDLPRPTTAAQALDWGHALCTSGTTGEPSVVFAPREALPEALHWYREEFGTGPEDRFLMLSAPGHDPVLRDVLVPLTTGAALHLPAAGAGPEALVELLAQQRITAVHATPGLAQLLASAARGAGRRLDRLRHVVLSGALLTDPVARELRRVAPAAEIHHGYGTTETPQLSSWLRWRDPARDPVRRRRDRAGVPLAAHSPWRELLVEGAGVGQLGEIVVRGRGLATGTSPEQEPSPFVPDPYGQPGVTAYRTGDLGRYTPDGLIEFVGRRDRQVSVGGHRLEPAEVEAALRAHGAVSQCAVVVSGTEITAFVAAPGAGPLLGEELRHELESVLPAWAVPHRIAVLEELPLDHNGKADVRAAAAALAAAAPDPAPLAGPAPSDTEEVIVAALREQLGDGPGVPDGGPGSPGRPEEAMNFFDAGLTSLSLLRMHERLRARGLPVEVVDLFRFPNPRLLARHLRGDASGPPGPARPTAPTAPAGAALTGTAAARRAVRRRMNDQKRTTQR
ncbi:non-ribosomal peptide synthetase [Streptomyces sp. NRRL F-2664]|uniref:non-ribosomal peptide synthetase n=1 Tax=Streptomyces sp. NRRL F-2664 TaxID=1463842 RepID=UPI0004CA3F5F|nr:non-ribosomal peptide synthetase [Streptomyces sp. NRRL F-2664]